MCCTMYQLSSRSHIGMQILDIGRWLRYVIHGLAIWHNYGLHAFLLGMVLLRFDTDFCE